MQSIIYIISIISLFTSTHVSSFPYNQIIVFGDSLTDDGSGTYSLLGGLLPLPPYYEGHFTNGHVWIEYLAQHLHLDYTRQVTNYAYGYALVNQEGPANSLPSLMATVNDYLITHKFNLSSSSCETLYVIFGGANDINTDLEDGLLTNQTIEQTLVATLPSLIRFLAKRIVDAGGRNVVVFQLNGKLSPFFRAETSTAQFQSMQNLTMSLNDDIEKEIANLSSSSGVEVKLYNPYDLWLDAFHNPVKYGLKNSTGYCFENWLDFMDGSATSGEKPIVCENPEEYLFWDGSGHPTTKFHEIWAGDIEDKMGWAINN